MSRMMKILAIDGGGIRGIIPAIILGEIERRSGKHTTELFDIIAGSSTGGLLALTLAVPDEQGQPAFTAEEIAMMYDREGSTIFSRGLWRSVRAVNNIRTTKYTDDGINEVLDRCFGERMLSEALSDVLVTSYEIQRREPWFFRSAKARLSDTCNFRMRDVVRATTAAPTYFEPAKVHHPELPEGDFFALIDGGMQANNPAMAAFVEARDKNPDITDYMVLSLGTGDHTRPIPYEDAKQWGLAGWAQHLMQVAFDGMSRSVDYQLKHLLPICADGVQHYYRIQSRLEHGASDDLDDVSSRNMQALRELGNTMVEQHDALLDQIVDVLLM